jgi:succinate-acetate transporter protein
LYSASGGSLAGVQRRALGLLFAVLTVAFALIAVAAAQAGRWPVALAAVVLGVWLGSLAVKGLRPR